MAPDETTHCTGKALFIATELDPIGGLNDSDWTITPN